LEGNPRGSATFAAGALFMTDRTDGLELVAVGLDA
jgi:hypothetical protein